MNKKKRSAGRLALNCALAFGIACSTLVAQEESHPTPQADDSVQTQQGPDLLSFDELIALASSAKPEGALAARFNALLNTPFVNHEASNSQPHRPRVEGLGVVLRVGQWNIERGLNFNLIRSALSDRSEFLRATTSARTDPRQREIIESQLATLQDVDVLILNEVDWGMKRTEYTDVARELAAALHMNYVYGVEFVEVDPVFELGTEQIDLPNAAQDLLEKSPDDTSVRTGKKKVCTVNEIGCNPLDLTDGAMDNWLNNTSDWCWQRKTLTPMAIR
ncbi:MAG: hypothetical protein ABSG02_04620 [Terriglobales bacterium]